MLGVNSQRKYAQNQLKHPREKILQLNTYGRHTQASNSAQDYRSKSSKVAENNHVINMQCLSRHSFNTTKTEMKWNEIERKYID